MGRWSGGGNSEAVDDLLGLIEDAAKKRRRCTECIGDGFVETWKYDPDLQREYPLMRICDCRRRHETLIRRLRRLTVDWMDCLTDAALDITKVPPPRESLPETRLDELAAQARVKLGEVANECGEGVVLEG